MAVCEVTERSAGAPSRALVGQRTPSASARRDRELFERVADGDLRAREELALRFMPLARSLALRYRRSREPLDDLLQVASLGLLKAINRFDVDREMAFSSFAVPTILGEIRRHFRDRTWVVRVPRSLQELSARVDQAVRALSEELRHPPTATQIAAAVGATQEDVLEALQAAGAYSTASLDAPRAAGVRDVGTLGESIGVTEDGFDRAEDCATLDTLLPMLTSREREVLRLRFEQDMTQAEIGAVVGVSQMQISRIIRGALARLRRIADRPSPSIGDGHAPPLGPASNLTADASIGHR